MGGEEIGTGPTSTDEMTNRIIDLATKYESYAPVPRVALFDIAFASNLEEHRRLGGMGVLLVSSVNQDSREHPIANVFAESLDKKYNLPLVAKRNVIVENDKVKKVIGINRVDYYYLIPYPITQAEGQITIDWSKNRKDFVLAKLPLGCKLNFAINTPDITPYAKVDGQSLERFLLREFSFKGELLGSICK